MLFESNIFTISKSIKFLVNEKMLDTSIKIHLVRIRTSYDNQVKCGSSLPTVNLRKNYHYGLTAIRKTKCELKTHKRCTLAIQQLTKRNNFFTYKL